MGRKIHCGQVAEGTLNIPWKRLLALYFREGRGLTQKNEVIQFDLGKEYEMLPLGTIWVNLENIMLSEMSPTETDKYHMTSVISGI